MSHPFSKLIDDTYKDLQRLKREVEKLLKVNKIDTEGKSFEEIINLIKELNILTRGVKYSGFIVDRQGYIEDIFDVIHVEETRNLPDDVTWGYYKIENGKLIIDEERKRLTEEVL